MFEMIKDFLINFFKSRLFVLSAVIIVLFGILIQRVFFLQIVSGEEYLNNYTLKIEKQRELKSTRGQIFDRNGKLLAYNELAYTITIEDNGSYEKTAEKNASLNKELEDIILKLDSNGDKIDNTFKISRSEEGEFSFNVEGTALQRFLADVYGRTSVDDLKYNEKLKYDEGEATADQVMEYLQGETRFDVTPSYEGDMAYRITVIRYAMSENSYQKYISTTIATDVSEDTVAYISENASNLQGVEVVDDTIRKYADSKYFSQIIGYTGKISQEEYSKLSENSTEYSLTDIIGKSGIEQNMDSDLQGKKGSETVYVDNLGKVVETTKRVEPEAGNNVYLSIDADLSKAVYDLLEKQIAGIVYAQMRNVKNYSADSERKESEIKIPIDDVYFALINNNVIDAQHFAKEDATATEQVVYGSFSSKQSSVLGSIQTDLTSGTAATFASLNEEMKDYITCIINMLRTSSVLDKSKIDTTDDVYQSWAEGSISLSEYLNYAVSKNWIDITKFSVDEKYSDSSEIYMALVNYINEELPKDSEFCKVVYKYMIQQDQISGTQLCVILFDQGVLTYDEAQIASLISGGVSAFDFIREKIRNLEITPAQLALDPCSGSSVITDVNTGELLALVSYPGYDNNRLANTVDANYYAQLTMDHSNPLYNYATQEKTAPGSTFKIVTATAGMAEGVITAASQIADEAEFTKITPSPKCWAYPSNHGLVNVSEAIRDSCNYFFYETSYRLSTVGDTYKEDIGTEKIRKYAELYGLADTTGIEIPENDPKIANEYPIVASIGQSNNNYTTAQIARYITAVANSGTVYNYTLLQEVQNSKGKVIKEFAPSVKNTIDVLDGSQWDAIHSGMRMVVEKQDVFKDFPVNVAGKTGTAQIAADRANHALFVGYAPYEAPQISIATRIAYGYTSHNAAAVSQQILAYYFDPTKKEELLDGKANVVSESSNAVTD